MHGLCCDAAARLRVAPGAKDVAQADSVDCQATNFQPWGVFVQALRNSSLRLRGWPPISASIAARPVMSATSPKTRTLRSPQFTALYFALPDFMDSSQLGLVSVLPEECVYKSCSCTIAFRSEDPHLAVAAVHRLVLRPARFYGLEPARLGIGVAGGMRVQELLVHHRVERLDVALNHRAEAFVLEVEDLLLAHCQISFAVCTTRSSLHRCSSCVP